MHFADSEVSPPLTTAERSKRFRQNSPEAWRVARARYRHDRSKHVTDAVYLSRLFTAWDGEGITRDDGSHDYVMLAVKNERESDYLFDPEGLGTEATFEFVLNYAERHRDTIHVIYGGGYDFNMWFRDVPRDVLERLYTQKFVDWDGYRMGWRRGKSFYLARVGADRKARYGVTIYDCAPFFQCPFVKACDDYLGEDFYRREVVVENKALRSSFTRADIPKVREYNDIELTNLLRLMVELRRRLNKVGLRPKRWDGPGAVASALLTRERIKDAKAESPDAVLDAARHAYAGGRFEIIKFGSVVGTAYEYDVNSAYPTALRDVPNLARGHWEHYEGDPGFYPFALYHIEYRGKRADIPGAFFRRDPNGTVCFPLNVTGWYWTPEYAVGREYCQRGNGRMTVLEAWVFVPDDDHKPFAFINELYRARAILKAQKDGAHVGIKLGLNSLYGKLAQQVGAEKQRDGTWRIPPFHQIEWAGYTTSHCRATVLRACLDNLDKVIAFETDAVFSMVPLPVTVGDGLGEFGEDVFNSLTYVQSGLYFARKGAAMTEKTRGIDRGSMHEADILEALAIPTATERHAPARLTRFIGLGIALAQGMEKWRRWQTIAKRVRVEPSGKRLHGGCACAQGRAKGISVGAWHSTFCPLLNDAHSAPFPVMWAGDNLTADHLRELRDRPPEYD